MHEDPVDEFHISHVKHRKHKHKRLVDLSERTINIIVIISLSLSMGIMWYLSVHFLS